MSSKPVSIEKTPTNRLLKRKKPNDSPDIVSKTVDVVIVRRNVVVKVFLVRLYNVTFVLHGYTLPVKASVQMTISH